MKHYIYALYDHQFKKFADNLNFSNTDPEHISLEYRIGVCRATTITPDVQYTDVYLVGVYDSDTGDLVQCKEFVVALGDFVLERERMLSNGKED